MFKFLVSQPLNFPINNLSSIIFYMILLWSHVKADTLVPNFPSLQQQDTTYEPSLAVVIGIFSFLFVITMIILAYAKLCHGSSQVQNTTAPLNNHSPGLDKTVIESIPFFRFSSLKGSKEGLECSVCLSRFEDVEVLRLLPKCKHAFHIDCIDNWLVKHASCPLCRRRISPEDIKLVSYSNNGRDDSLFVHREESSRFSNHQRDFHKHNHKIVVSDFVFNNRWSDLSSSDLLSLNSEMLNETSSQRFSNINNESSSSSSTKKEVQINVVETRKLLENKGRVSRSVSEISVLSRHGIDSEVKCNEREERIRKVWLPIATRTVQLFANTERSQLLSSTNTHT